MLKSTKLHGVGPVRDLSASFGERLNVITGDNGLGKSFLLDVCFWSLTGTWPGGRLAIPDRNTSQPNSVMSKMRTIRKAGNQEEPSLASSCIPAFLRSSFPLLAICVRKRGKLRSEGGGRGAYYVLRGSLK